MALAINFLRAGDGLVFFFIISGLFFTISRLLFRGAFSFCCGPCTVTVLSSAVVGFLNRTIGGGGLTLSLIHI